MRKFNQIPSSWRIRHESWKQRALKALLAQYKHLEQEILTLTSMAQDDCSYTMLIERLRLTNWGLLR
jgi:hypothetical protein